MGRVGRKEGRIEIDDGADSASNCFAAGLPDGCPLSLLSPLSAKGRSNRRELLKKQNLSVIVSARRPGRTADSEANLQMSAHLLHIHNRVLARLFAYMYTCKSQLARAGASGGGSGAAGEGTPYLVLFMTCLGTKNVVYGLGRWPQWML